MTRSAGSPPPRPPVASIRSTPAHAPDYLLLTSVIMLCVIGLIAVYSASYALGAAEFKDANYFIKKQAFAFGRTANGVENILWSCTLYPEFEAQHACLPRVFQ